MTFYSDLASTATTLITDKGQSLSFTRTTDGSFDPQTGIDSTATTSTITIVAAAFNYKSGEIDGSLIQKGDVKLLATADVVPMIGDVNSKYGTIVSVKPLDPGGAVVVYELQCRP